MSVLVPPVRLACTANKLRIDYILNLANQKDFEFTPVSIKLLCHPITPVFVSVRVCVPSQYFLLDMHKTYLVMKNMTF